MKTIHKKQLFAVAVFLVIIACLAGYFIMTNIAEDSEQRLTEAQIAELRSEYPICGTKMPAGISMITPTLDDVKERADTFVYGQITGEPTSYFVSASTGNSQLDEKREENGLSDTYEFYEYPVTVISDTSGLYEEGQQITIAANKMFEDYNPHLSVGMEVVVPVQEDESDTSRTQFMVHGMYYVTEDGYALSAYEEEAATETELSGLKVESLLTEIEE